jgi:ERCC4-type nuclease
LYEPNTTSIACSFNCIRAFEKEQKALDKANSETATGLTPTEYQILKSIPGIGPVYAVGILAEIGSVAVLIATMRLPNTMASFGETTSLVNSILMTLQ